MLIKQIKDVQVAFEAHLEKRLKLTILITNILLSSSMIINQIFYIYLGGEIHMDWSQAYIPFGRKNIHLEQELQAKFTILKSDDPLSQMLYTKSEFSNYMLFSKYVENRSTFT